MRRLYFYILVLCIFWTGRAFAETYALPTIEVRQFSESEADISIDGKLEESIWQDIPAINRMRTVSPDTLAETPYATDIRFFYTEAGLYVGVWAEQPKDTQIPRLSSRDRFLNRDAITVDIDTSGEGLYAYWFSVALGGSVSDGTILPERQFSRQWDGPWHGAEAESDDGWSTEFFLPWSMMTMPHVDGDKRKIGFYVSRSVAHLGERWSWPALPDTGSRFLSALQELELDNITPKQQFTFYPYASTTYDVIESEDDYKAGFDIFWRPSSNLQLTTTVNPDFGNVESDDVIVNLTSFETFFPEKRPFFLEGQEIFTTTPRGRSRGRGTPTILVHTRRIGGPPEDLDIDDFDITSLEANQPTELHGAAKVTGQIDNWRYGVLTAIEDDTKVEGEINDVPVDFEQEGRAFAAARFLYETTDVGSRSGLGWITTLVDRPDGDAIVHGIDGHFLSSSTKWNIDGQLLFSDVDDERGSGGFVDVTYIPRQGVRHSFAFDYFDDELEINDFGFLRRNDAISARYRFGLTESDLPGLKSRETSMFLSQEYNTDGLVVRSGIFMNREWEFHNNSEIFAEYNYFPSRWDDTNSNGNGNYRIEPRSQFGLFWESDSTKALQFAAGAFYEGEDLGGERYISEVELYWQPVDEFSVNLNLRYQKSNEWLLHDSGREFTTYESEQWQPRFELDYFLSAKQQFRVTAQWVGIKAFEKDRYLVPLGDGSLIPDPIPANDNRDFSISRLVFQARYRWEIAPLSDLFVVYTRGSNLPNMPDDEFDDLLTNAWTDRIVDVLVVKLRYRLGS